VSSQPSPHVPNDPTHKSGKVTIFLKVPPRVVTSPYQSKPLKTYPMKLCDENAANVKTAKPMAVIVPNINLVLLELLLASEINQEIAPAISK
jgi:hypothetical protein